LKIAGLVAFLTLLSGYQPPPPKLQHIPAEPRADLAIEKTTEAYRKAVLAGDTSAVGATYGRDAVLMPPSHPPLKGRAAIERYYRELFGGPMKIADFTFTHLETATAGNIGFTTGAYKQKLLPKSGEPIEDSGSFVVIVKRDVSGWKSAYVMYNSDRPPAMPGAIGPAFISPFPALMNYYSAIASQWLFRFALFGLGCICFGLIARLLRSLLPANASLKARRFQGEA
jgi:ketosteroid isomerase-like protein